MANSSKEHLTADDIYLKTCVVLKVLFGHERFKAYRFYSESIMHAFWIIDIIITCGRFLLSHKRHILLTNITSKVISN